MDPPGKSQVAIGFLRKEAIGPMVQLHLNGGLLLEGGSNNPLSYMLMNKKNTLSGKFSGSIGKMRACKQCAFIVRKESWHFYIPVVF